VRMWKLVWELLAYKTCCRGLLSTTERPVVCLFAGLATVISYGKSI